jgi:hypothetical protein
MGGVVPMTPVHAFEATPKPLRLGAAPVTPAQRRDIDVGGLLAFVIDPVVSAAEADAIVTASGCELISRGVPVDADEIEALMRG